MRTWRGLDPGATKDPRVREALTSISDFLYDVGAAVGSISRGENPGGSSGTPLPGAVDDGLLHTGDDLQAAIDAAEDYAVIRLAAGYFKPSNADGYIIKRPITIEGVGAQYVFDGIGTGGKTVGTVVRFYNPTGVVDGGKDSCAFQIIGTSGYTLTNVHLKNIAIENDYTAATLGTGDGIRVDATDGYVGHCRFENVSVLYAGRDGLHCDGASLGISFDQSTISRCQFDGCYRHGMYMRYATDVALDNSSAVGNQQCGMYFKQSTMLHLHHCLFNENGKLFVTSGTDWLGQSQAWPYYDQAQLYFQGCSGFTVDGCDFEVWAYHAAGNMPVPHAIGLYATRNGRIMDCSSYNSDYVAAAVESYFAMFSACFDITIGNNNIGAVDYYVYALADSGNMGLVVLPGGPTDYEANPTWTVPHNDAPCRVYLPNGLETSGGANGPTGGNFATIPLIDASTIGDATAAFQLSRFIGGLQLPRISATSAFTHTLQNGTLTIDGTAHRMKLYENSAWTTLPVIEGAQTWTGLQTFDNSIVLAGDHQTITMTASNSASAVSTIAHVPDSAYGLSLSSTYSGNSTTFTIWPNDGAAITVTKNEAQGLAITLASGATSDGLFVNKGSTTVAGITADGYVYTPRLQLTDATGDKLTIVPAAVTTAHTLTMPGAQGAANAILQNNGSGALSWTANPTLDGANLGAGLVVDDYIAFTSSTGGGDGSIDFSLITSSGVVIQIPNGSGQVLIANASQNVQNKTLYSNCKLRTDAATPNPTFQDSVTTTKAVALDLTGISASTTRKVKFHDVSGSYVLVGNTTSASGTLGKSDLTAQTASIGATTMMTGNTVSAGMYRVSAYLKTTTAGAGGDIVTMTVAWNDGAAQTVGMPFITAAGGVVANHDLGTLNAFSQGSVVVNVAASQNVTYTTTVTKAGSPQYEIHVRIEQLG